MLPEALSPELALVDPDAAAAARKALPPVELTEDRVRRRPAPAVEQRPRRRWRRVVLGLAAAVTVGAAIGVAWGALSDRWTGSAVRTVPQPTQPTTTRAAATGAATSNTTTAPPTTAETTTAETKTAATTTAPARTVTRATPPSKPSAHAPATTRTRTRTTTHEAAPPPAPVPTQPTTTSDFLPDFVWVAATGVHRYRVEFSSGSRVAFRAETKEARLRVRRAQLPPGHYRWRVWALDGKGGAAPTLLVDAALDVS
jgi:hypothetical protein